MRYAVAMPKCWSIVSPSLLVNATFMRRSSPSVVRQPLRLGGARLEQVRDLEDQVHGPAVADPHPLVRAQPVEDGQPRPQVGLDAERGRGLASVRARDQEVDAARLALQVLDVAHEEG